MFPVFGIQMGMIRITGTTDECDCVCTHCYKQDGAHCLYCSWLPPLPVENSIELELFVEPAYLPYWTVSGNWQFDNPTATRARAHVGVHTRKRLLSTVDFDIGRKGDEEANREDEES